MELDPTRPISIPEAVASQRWSSWATERHLSDLVRAGRLPAAKLRGRVVVRPEDIDRYEQSKFGRTA